MKHAKITRAALLLLRSFRTLAVIAALLGITLVCLALLRRPDAASPRVVLRADAMTSRELAQAAPRSIEDLGSWVPQGSHLSVAQIATLAADVYAAPTQSSPTVWLLNDGRLLRRRTELSTRVCCTEMQTHLVADVWTVMGDHASPGLVQEVVLVFRGTVNSGPDGKSSWCSNLRELPLFFCDEAEDQHRAVPTYGARTLAVLRSELSDGARLTLVGHSLGASLALSALPELLPGLLVAFNGSFAETSDLIGPLSQARTKALLQRYNGGTADRSSGGLPVGREVGPNDPTLASLTDDDWRWLLGRKQVPYAVLWITEQGEVLADVQRLLAVPLLAWRARSKPLHLQRPRVDIDLNVLSGDPVTQHGIEALACVLLRLPESCRPDERHARAFDRRP